MRTSTSKKVRAPVLSQKCRTRHYRPLFETLESRITPTTALLLSGTVLTIKVDPGETAVLTQVGGQLRVTDAGHLVTADAAAETLGFAASANPNTTSDPKLSTDVTAIVVTSNGAGGGVVALGASDVLFNTWTLTVNASGGARGTFDLSGFNETVNALNVTNSGTVTNTGGGTPLVTVNGGGSIGGSGNSGTVGVANNLNLTISGTTTFFFINGAISANITTIDPGATLQIGTVDTTSFSGPNATVDNGTLIFGAPVSEGYNGISGAGQLIVRSGNTLNLFNSNTYSGGTTIDSGGKVNLFGSAALPNGGDMHVDGTLDIQGHDVTVGGLTDGGTVTNGAGGTGTNTVTVGATGTFDGVIQNGATAKTALSVNAGTLTLTHANTYTGATSISSGATLKLGINNAIASGSSVAVEGTFDLNGFNDTIGGLTGSGTVTNSGASGTNALTVSATGSFAGVIQDGATAKTALSVSSGTLTLTHANTYTGATSVSSGATLKLGVTNAIASASSVSVKGTFDLSGFNETVNALNVTNSGTVTNTGGGTPLVTVNGGGSIGGSGNSGTVGVANNLNLTISGTATFFFINGTIDGATATINPGATMQIGTVDTTSFGGPNATVDNGTLIFGGPLSESYSKISGAGQIIVRNGNTLELFNSNTYSGGTTIDSGGKVQLSGNTALPSGGDVHVDGTLDIRGFNVTVGALTGGGTITNGASGTGTNTVTVTATSSFGGIIQNGATAKTALSTSARLLTLTNVNTYTGTTSVSAGTLLVNGSIASNVTVSSGATLGGTGTINSANTVTVSNGGHLAPGASPGVLSTGGVQLFAGSNFDVQITNAAAGQFDQANVTGTVNIVTTNGGVALNVSKFGNLSLNNGDELVIIKNDGNGATGDAVQGTFKGLPEGFNLGSNFLGSGLTAKITYKGGDGNDVSIKLSPGSLFPWHNNAKPLDVIGSPDVPPDGHIVAGDAIAVINYLNAFGPGPVPANAVLGLPFGFLDTTGGPNGTGDNSIAPNDALEVINAINAGLGGEGACSYPHFFLRQ